MPNEENKKAEVTLNLKSFKKLYDSLLLKVDDLEKRMAKVFEVVEGLQMPVNSTISTNQTDQPVEPPSPASQLYPMPLEYRALADDILNKNFGLMLEPDPQMPSFRLTVVVPEQYSSLTPKEKEMIKQDLRTKVVNYSDGVNGVRIWLSTVYNSFSPEMKAKIQADKSNA